MSLWISQCVLGFRGENDLSACTLHPADRQEELGKFARVYKHLQGTVAMATSVTRQGPSEATGSDMWLNIVFLTAHFDKKLSGSFMASPAVLEELLRGGGSNCLFLSAASPRDPCVHVLKSLIKILN